MHYYSIDIATRLHNENRPWAVRVEYVGYNKNNVGRESAKFWEIYSTGNGRVFVNWGALGSSGQKTPKAIDFWEALDKLSEKRNKGYSYCTETSRHYPTSPRYVADLPEPFRAIRRLVDLGNGFFRAEDSSNQMLMELDGEGKRQIMNFNPFVSLVTL